MLINLHSKIVESFKSKNHISNFTPRNKSAQFRTIEKKKKC